MEPALSPPSLAIVVPVIGLLAFAALPRSTANRWPQCFAFALTAFGLLAAGLALAGLVLMVAQGSAPGSLTAGSLTYLDSLTLAMALLVSLLGTIIAQYSRNYLDGDPFQGEFFRHLALTVAASLLLVLSGHLLLTAAAWIFTSLGLHRLLTHKRDRPWAIWAARKKFLISRLGDMLLVAALLQTYRCFGALDYDGLFEAAQAIRAGSAPAPSGVEWIGALLALGAMTKSAQFPFHSWLPDTLETPTPVSALMHAGVINAGGFLVIRLSPLMVLSSAAMHLLVGIGAFTALFAAVVMLTQPSIKRVLAYSTISQMGFMMLQCGLGAWSAAVLHILAHSAYKSYAFLASGNALEDAAEFPGAARRPISTLATGALLLGTAVLLGALATTFSVERNGRSSIWLLLFILGLAIAHLLRTAWSQRNRALLLRALAMVLVMGALITAGHWGVSALLAGTAVSTAGSVAPLVSPWLTGGIAAAFLLAFLLEGNGWQLWSRRLSQSLYVHASNGFYLDIPPRRVTAWVYGQRGATP